MVQGWGENDRGVSYTFGPDSVTEFLSKHDLDLICRAHQVCSRSQVLHVLSREPLAQCTRSLQRYTSSMGVYQPQQFVHEDVATP